jgi:hypothetical protein
MSLATGQYQVSSAFKTLQVHWEQTCRAWRDSVRHEFTTTYWNELETRIPALLTAADRLDQVLNRMKQDCGDHGP